jgi:NADH-quinone oxidoreductase subunit M
MALSRSLPFAATAFVLAAMASMGLPGFSGFVGEFMVLSGTWRAMPVVAAAVAFGILLGVAYMWRTVQAAFFAAPDAAAPAGPATLAPITLPEKIGTALLLAASLIVGLFPQLLTNAIAPALAALSNGRWQ